MILSNKVEVHMKTELEKIKNVQINSSPKFGTKKLKILKSNQNNSNKHSNS